MARDAPERSGIVRLDGGAARLCLSAEEIGQIHGVDGALKGLLKTVSAALGIALAVVHLPTKRRTIRFDSEEKPLPNAGKAARDFAGWLGDRALRSGLDDHAAFTAVASDACHTAAVRAADGAVDGALFAVRTADEKAFTDGEIRVLNAVADNIGEIIAARFDPLTGLVNQPEFDYVLAKAVARGKREDATHSVLHVNLDDVGTTAESFGSDAADAAILGAAATLTGVLGDAVTVAHLGRDEFGVLLENCPTDRGWAIGQDLRRAIRDMSVAHEEPLKLTASIGVASLSGSETVASVQAAARIACIVAKDRGRDRVVLYRHQDAASLHTEAAFRIARNIQEALRDDRFCLYCQSIEPLVPGGEPRSYEILLRGKDADGRIVLPSEFLPQAEHNRLMPAIDRWVIRQSFEALADVRRSLDSDGRYFAINLSGQSLCEGSFLDFIRNELNRTRLPPEFVCFEVTETAAILNISDAIALMSSLRDWGCRFSLDDFGSGLSSFSYLKTLPIDHLKIDGQFVKEIVEDPVSNAMVAAINQMSHALGLKTIAEFVENRAIRTQLAGIGIDFGQGYGIGRPGPLTDVLERQAKVRLIRRSRAGR